MDLLTGVPLFQGGHGPVPQFARDYPVETEKTAVESSQREPIEHRIVDGDTLAGLAQRYLGEPGRAVEIFDANRDVLSNPELLPIGAVLKMPMR
jgi:nucleoid-associated protein YgaU